MKYLYLRYKEMYKISCIPVTKIHRSCVMIVVSSDVATDRIMMRAQLKRSDPYVIISSIVITLVSGVTSFVINKYATVVRSNAELNAICSSKTSM